MIMKSFSFFVCLVFFAQLRIFAIKNFSALTSGIENIHLSLLINRLWRIQLGFHFFESWTFQRAPSQAASSEKTKHRCIQADKHRETPFSDFCSLPCSLCAPSLLFCNTSAAFFPLLFGSSTGIWSWIHVRVLFFFFCSTWWTPDFPLEQNIEEKWQRSIWQTQSLFHSLQPVKYSENTEKLFQLQI